MTAATVGVVGWLRNRTSRLRFWATVSWLMPVSYTHLDVYKRQSLSFPGAPLFRGFRGRVGVYSKQSRRHDSAFCPSAVPSVHVTRLNRTQHGQSSDRRSCTTVPRLRGDPLFPGLGKRGCVLHNAPKAPPRPYSRVLKKSTNVTQPHLLRSRIMFRKLQNIQPHRARRVQPHHPRRIQHVRKPRRIHRHIRQHPVLHQIPQRR